MLFLNNLSIKNFKNIKSADFKFSKINLIEGDTGEGKTAIVQAIALLFCNYISGKMEDYINWNAEAFELESNFYYPILEKSYSYNINVSKKKGTNRILSGGTITELYGNDLTRSDTYKYIANNIVDPHLTIYSSISEQNKTAVILTEALKSPTKSLEIIKKIFGIDKINNIVDNIKTDVSELKNQSELLEVTIVTLQGRLYEYLEEPDLPKIDINNLKQQLQDLDKQRELYIEEMKQYEVYKEQLKNYIDSANKIKELENVIKSDLKHILDLEKDLIIIEDFDINNYNQRKEKFNTTEKDFIKLNFEKDNIEKLKENLIFKEDNIKELEKKSNNIKIIRIGRCNYTEKDKQEIEIKIRNLSSFKLTLEDRKKAIEDGKCPIGLSCTDENLSKSDTSLVDKDIKDAGSKIQQLHEQFNKINIEINNYEESVRKNENNSKEKEYITQSIEKEKKEYEDIKKNIEKFDVGLYNQKKSIIDNLKNELQNLELEKNNYDQKIELNKQKEIEIEKINQQVLLNKERIKDSEKIQEPEERKISLNFDESLYNNINNEIQNYYSIEREIQSVRERNEKIKEDEKKNNLEIEKKYKEKENIDRKILILKESQKELNKNFSAYLVDRKTKYINIKMNEFFNRAYDGKYNIKFEQDVGKEGFYYSQNSKDWYSTVTLSGFEEQLYSVAFRLALSSLQDLGLFIVDEVDSNASTEKSLALYKNLLNEESIGQFFIITHNDETKEFISNQQGAKIFTIENGVLV